MRDTILTSMALDVLVLLCSEPARWWNVESVAGTLRMSESSPGTALEDLGRANLLDVGIGESLTYRFAPVDETVSKTIPEITALHFTARDAIIHAQPGGQRGGIAARRIADAFLLPRRTRHE